jgi:hypothetical protein
VRITWNALKNERLKITRGVSFEELLGSELIAIQRHPTKERQGIMLILHKRYIWVVPFVKSEDGIFLKTLFQSRKYTKIFKEGRLS